MECSRSSSSSSSSPEELCFTEQKGAHVVLQWMQRLRKTNKMSQSEADVAAAKYSHYTMELGTSPLSSLQLVLHNPILMEEFAKFTIEEWSVENVLFNTQVEMFKATFQEAAPLAFEKARRIFKEFIVPGASMEINVDSETKRVITEMIKQEKLCGDMFQRAQRQVFHLMETDTFPKWQKKSSFKDAVERVLAYQHQHQRAWF